MLVPFLLALTGDPKPVDQRVHVVGSTVQLCGDLDGDGRSEFAISGGDGAVPGIVIYGGRYGGVFRFVTTDAPDERIGRGFCRTSDVNDDGVDDMALAISSNAPGVNRVELRSGKSGEVIRAMRAQADEDSFGIGLTSIGDVDADGVDDIVVTALHPAPRREWNGACWIVVSGATGRRLQVVDWCGKRGSYWLLAASNADAFALGDVNRDSVSDFAVVDELSVRVQSGARPETLHTFELPDQGGKRGDRYAVCGRFDLDCDGFNDIAVATPFVCGRDWEKPYEYVRIYSGRTGSQLRVISRPSHHAGFGFAMISATDRYGAGSFDLWVTQHDPFSNGAWLISADDGREKLAISFNGDDFVFGWSIAGGADVDGDGIDDVIVSSYSPFASNHPRSGAHVYSGKDGRLLHEKLAGWTAR